MVEVDSQWPPGSSDAGAFIRTMDWSTTPLGLIPSWHPLLRIAVSDALASPVATIVLWGTDFTQVYNDSYLAILGSRHPVAMGQATRECWPESWQFVEPIYAKVMTNGETVHCENQKFEFGPPNNTTPFYFTVTFSAVRDDIGRIHGVLVRAVETTKAVTLERENEKLAAIARCASNRQAFNLQLADTLRSVATPDDVIAYASELLGVRLGASRVVYCDIDDVNETFDIRRDWTSAGVASIAGKNRRLSEFGDDIVHKLRSNNFLAVDDVTTDARTSHVREAYLSLGVKSFLAMPLPREGKLLVVLTVHKSETCKWSDEDVRLTHDFIERTWAAAENANAQAKMKLERDRSQAVLDSMMEGFAIIAHDGEMLQMNEAGLRMAQRCRSEVIGHNHWDIWPEAKGSPLEKFYSDVMETGIAGGLEYEHTYDTGLKRWLELRAYRTPNNELAVFYRDIGDRKFAQAALIEADHRKDEFLAMLAHELRNPLSPISASASLLLLARHDEQKVKRASEIISRQVRHMSSLLDDLLDVSRVTRGIIELDKTILDARIVVADAVEQVQPLVESHHHRLLVNLPPENTFVFGDQKRLVQVLTNLLNNSAKYTPSGGEILISMEIRENNVVISVSDTGIGMAPELLTRAFHLFAQESRTSDRSQGGLGLGLALVKRLVELHDGTVTARSDGLGQGSEFTVVFPRVGAPSEYSGRDSPSNTPEKIAPLRILVVDDNADAANSLALLLSTLGYSVVVELNGNDALAKTRNERFDVCILDIGLPDIGGYELGRSIKTDSASIQSTLIALTGYGQKQDEIDSSVAGFEHHLVKPVNTTGLIQILASLEPSHA